MSERLTLQDLIDLLAQKKDLTKKDAESFLRELVALISETIEADELVRIKDFGTFKLTTISARKSVDVNTGEDIKIPAHYRLSFTPEKTLREDINKPFAHFESVILEDGITFEDAKEEFQSKIQEEEENDLSTTITAEEEKPKTEKKEEKAIELTTETQKEEEKEKVVEKIVIVEEKIETPIISETITIIEENESKANLNSVLEELNTKDLSTDTEEETTDDMYSNEKMKQNISDALTRDFYPNNDKHGTIEERIERILSYQPKVIIQQVAEHKIEDKVEALQEEPAKSSLETKVHTNPIEEKLQEEAKEEFVEEVSTPLEPMFVEEKQVEKEEEIVAIVEKEEVKEPILETYVAAKQEEDEDKEIFFDDDYMEQSSSKKKYLWMALAFALVILAIFGGKYLLSEGSNKKMANQEQTSSDSDRKDITSEEANAEKEEKEVEPEEPKEPEIDPLAPIGEAVITRGQTLRLIADRFYGEKTFWIYIYEDNKTKIKNPNSVPIGTKLIIPSLKKFNVDAKNPKDVKESRIKESKLILELTGSPG